MIKTESPNLNKSPSKVKKRKNELISDILSETISKIKIKKEPIFNEPSWDNSSIYTPSKSKDKVKTKKQNTSDTQDLISKLVSQQTKNVSQKKRSKFQNDSHDLSSEALTLKKIKIERNSEDEAHVSTTPSKVKKETENDPTFSEKVNRTSKYILSPVKVKQEKDDNEIRLSRERDNLEKLFPKADEFSRTDSDKKFDLNKTENIKKTSKKSIYNGSLYVADEDENTNSKSSASKKKRKRLKGDSISSPQDGIHLSKSKMKTVRHSSDALNQSSFNISQAFDLQNSKTRDSLGHKITPTKSIQYTSTPFKTNRAQVPMPLKTEAEDSYGELPQPIQAKLEHTSNVRNKERVSMSPKSNLVNDMSDSSSASEPEYERQKKNKRKRLESPPTTKKLVSALTRHSLEEQISGINLLTEEKASRNRLKSSSKTKDSNMKVISKSKGKARTSGSKKNVNSSISNSEMSEEEHNVSRKADNEKQPLIETKQSDSSSSDSEVELPQVNQVKAKNSDYSTNKERISIIPANKLANATSDSSSDSESKSQERIQNIRKRLKSVGNKLDFVPTNSSSEEEELASDIEQFMESYSVQKKPSNRLKSSSRARNSNVEISQQKVLKSPKKSKNISSLNSSSKTSEKENNVSRTQNITPGNRNSATESSSDEELPVSKPRQNEVPVPLSIKTERKAFHSKTESSSDEEVPVPKPRQIKKKEGAADEVPVPKPRLIEKKEVPIETDNKASDSETGSSSDEEVPIPKPRQNEKKKFPIPPPIKTDDKTSQSEIESSSDEEIPVSKPQQIEKKIVPIKADHTAFHSETESSSDEEAPVPKPRQIEKKVVPKPLPIKTDDKASQSETESSSDEEVPVPRPRQIEKKVVPIKTNDKASHLERESSSDEEIPVPKPRQIEKKIVPIPLPIKTDDKASNSETESSSDEEVPASKPRQIKKKVVPKPLPIKTDDKASHSETKSSSDGEVPVPKPQQIEKKVVPIPLPIKTTDKASHSETESSSDEQVPVPQPRQIKADISKTRRAAIEKNHVPVPLPIKEVPVPKHIQIKSDISMTPKARIGNKNNKRSDSEDNSFQDEAANEIIRSITNKVQTLQNESVSEDEMPLPKKAKKEGKEMSSDNEYVQGNSSSKSMERAASESSWKEKSQYKAMNWMEKLEHRFPGIEQQSVATRLPKTNTNYSLLLVPKHIDPLSLLNLKCSLTKKKSVSLNNKEYIFEPLPKKPDPIVVNVKGPQLVELQRVISLQRALPELTLKELNVPKREDISLPSAIKVRHPLFGVRYKGKLRLDKHVKQKLQEAMERKRKVEEKERKKRKVKSKNSFRDVEEDVLNIFNSITTPEANGIDIFPVKTEEDKPKSKKKHKEKGTSISEPLQNKTKKHKSHVKHS